MKKLPFNPSADNAAANVNPLHAAGVIFKTCQNCGKEFSVPAIQKRGRKQIYCTYRCGTDFYYNSVRENEDFKARSAAYQAGNPAKRFLSSTKRAAKLRKLGFDLTEQWIQERLDRGICEITGLPIKVKQYKQSDIGSRSFFSPSIDRIDNSVGYIPSNCRIVCWGYNLAKNQFTDREINALAVSLILQSLPLTAQTSFLSMLPKILLASLPSDHALF